MIEPPRITPENRQHYLELAQQARRLQADRADPIGWISRNLSIRTKTRSVVPLRPNWVQRDYFAHRTQWDILLKARQVGITTGVSALFFADTVLTPNTTSVMLAHNLDSTEQIFGIVQLFWERLPEEEKAIIGKPRCASRREMYWSGPNSRFLVGTAGSTRFGRGITVNNLHCSEFAIWPNPEEALLAAMEAVPQDGRIVIESTANGVGNALYDRWVEAVEGRSRFVPRYHTWFEHPEYALAGPPLGELTEEERKLKDRWQLTDDQLRWRRQKQADLGSKLDQEYPSDWVTAFLASGRCVFDTQELRAVQARIAAEPGPSSLASLLLPSGEPVTVAPAILLIWRRPEAGHRYVVGADVGEGLEDGDASCAVVLDRQSGEQAAELHGRVPPAQSGTILDALAPTLFT